MSVYRWRYRWYYGWSDLWQGIKNVYKWFPHIWRDRDYDWAFLADMMEFKLRNMSRCISNGYHVNAKRDARRMLICAELLKRLVNEDSQLRPDCYFVATEETFKFYQQYLGVLLGKYLRTWWD